MTKSPCRKWKISFFALLFLFIISCLCFANTLLDQGISYTYLGDSYVIAKRELNTLRDLTKDKIKKTDLLRYVKSKKLDDDLFFKEGFYHINGISFKFDKNNQLIELQFIYDQ